MPAFLVALIAWLVWYVVRGVILGLLWFISWKLAKYATATVSLSLVSVGLVPAWPDLPLAELTCVVQKWFPLSEAWSLFLAYWSLWLSCFAFRFGYKQLSGSSS